ncbi:hypothetical protein ACFOUP_16325 [Belliella kenyensis]|uniref:Restriction endonuclease n=1 Tax=Belliella kenyensis TaxID=1472724 RepID=A0ABV8ENQ2_9BACT|nr:hypothetical protein [Belliella kenyensis]MCH7403851.1 hypothetical protein [Belliella kenyensis]MDN3603016.1 hypothetical protein [Belliella kenyensis]
MNWTKFITYGDSPQNAFETLCNQLFERFLKRTYKTDLIKFRVINGAGGDGGIEAYGQLSSGDIVAVQAKWFQQSLDDSEIKQIRNSILTAKKLRTQIKEYIICIPHDVSSLKIGRGNKPTTNHEENKINALIDEIYSAYPDLKLTWWFDNEILTELQQANNEGVHKFWFDKEVISLDYLSKHFALQKKGWLHERYIPELHGQGIIHEEYQKLCFSIQYRKELFSQATQAISDLKFCINQIEHFIPTNTTVEITDELNIIKENLIKFLEELQKIATAVKTGNDFYKPVIFSEVDLWKTKLKLEKLNANNIQKNILPKLISSLDNIHKYDLPQYIQHFAFSFNQKIRLVIGEPGTGKTHGLSNCVEIHLAANSPAIIIQAKGTPFNDWTEILSKSLGITNWRKDEILSALETLATKNDVQKATTLKAGEEYDSEITKAIVCIDGLEEEIENEKEWYARIRECEQLTVEYPRVRFVFSARRYFYNSEKVPQRGIFEDVFLSREGDVAIDEVAPHYFSKDHYNIQLSSPSLIRGLDSLLALRLFCEEYKNRSINATDKIVTATRGLINLKIDRLNEEFISKLQGKKGATRNPIMDSLEIIAKFFYKNHEAEHNQMVDLISPVLKSYLDGSEIDSLLDYLADNAFLIRFERTDNDGVLTKRKYYYSITYQSLIEHIISERIYHDIKSGSLNRIPQFLHEVMMRPLDFNPKDSFSPFEISPNEKIIQNIINNSLIESGKLIGENNFLTEGFDEWEIKKYQLTAISKAPGSVAKNFKAKIDGLFNGGYTNLSYVLEYLILPSSYSSDSVFGAEYLHQTLLNLSVFERDKMWSGLDMHETGKLSELERHRYQYESSKVVFRELGVGKPILFEWYLHNERPLVFAWGLSTIDQELRNDLRVSLAGWAIKSPSEFLLLLKKIFSCNDPQIQEDLASIMLGVASRLKDKERIKELALWSIENIFNHLDIHRNIIVRQGFRAIVERAFQYGVISNDEVEKCRPRPMQTITLLPLERNLTTTGQGECYPIVHDLAWYVIGKAYDDFLEYPSSLGDGLKDNDCTEAKALLNEYRKAYKDDDLFASNWGMAVGIAYIRNLGLTRVEGNWHTQASHGSKSKVFTYEEKYTWLAVHYIQGYLSDYIPAKRWSGNREFVSDYSQITDVPNPAESVLDLDKEIEKLKIKKEWIIKEVLSKELETGIEINQSITNWVNEEPVFDLEKWLSFDSTDFQIDEPNRKWLALYNDTSLHDSKQFCYSYFYSVACLIKKEDLPSLIKIIQSNPDSLHFISHMDGFHSSPRTDTYCNPTDIVWMTWIEEDETEETFYDGISDDEKYLHHTITEITQNDINGESYIRLPSKKVRELIDCYELLGSELKDANGKTLAFNHKKSDGAYRDSQELVLVDKDVLEKLVDKEGYEIVWFVELFKKKNPLNESLDKDFHVQRTRKYFVWTEMNEKNRFKFWDEWFSNQRDKNES